MNDIQGDVSSKFTNNSTESLTSEENEVQLETRLNEETLRKCIEKIYIREGDEKNYKRRNCLSGGNKKEKEIERKFRVQINIFNEILKFREILANLSFDIIRFYKTQRSIEIDEGE
jgi:hypothetical protein